MSPAAPKKENLLLNLACNILVPTIVLTKLSEEKYLGAQNGIIVALMFPLGYGIYDLVKRKKANLFSIIGVVSVLLTGILNQLKADVFWFAVKEAAMPTLLGAALLASMKTKRPLVRELLWNDAVIDTAKVEAALDARGHRNAFETQMVRANYGMAASFLLSAVLNYGVAMHFLDGKAPGSEAYTAALGKITGWGFVITGLPMMAFLILAFMRLLKRLQDLTGLSRDELMVG